ncbi:MAG TPA: GNAT family N-acetyltransferase [Acetobacteraceae bacterium]|nr:GNAT family N-acetyltransferase [Acetobacteraceae bacterium]
MTGAAVTLRDAEPSDLPVLLGFVRALAEYERLSHEMQATEEDFRRALFGDPPRAHALLAEQGGAAIGFAVWFYNFSTFEGRPGLYVEDVFIDPAHRGRGIGRMIFKHLAQRALQSGCARMEWWVLDWNEPAIHFYRGIGAEAMEEWTVQRVAGEALVRLAEGQGGSAPLHPPLGAGAPRPA